MGYSSYGPTMVGGSRHAARLLVEAAAYDDGKMGAAGNALTALTSFAHVLRRAIEANPAKDQKRSRTGSPRPIKLIHEALFKGWLVHHRGERINVSLSSSPTSDFSEIVRLCYGAMSGRHDYNAERAIKAYVRWHRIQKQHQSRERDAILTIGSPAEPK